MIKKLLLKWYTVEEYGTDNGRYWLATDLLSEVFGKDMSIELTSDEMIDTVIKAYYKKYRFKQLIWWIRYGFKANKMYWYAETR